MVISSEKDVKARIRSLLTKHGWFSWMPPANGYGRTGIADINAVKDGRLLVVEAKFGKNIVSPMQRGFLRDVHNHGGYAFVVNENRLGHLETWLQAFDRGTVEIEYIMGTEAVTIMQQEI